MSKRTVSADGGAMPAEGQQSEPTAESDRSSALLDIVDELSDIRFLIEAAHMAATELPSEQCGPMQTLLDFVSQKLSAARDKLDAARPQPEETANV